MSVAAVESFEPYVEEEEPKFQEWIAEQNLTDKEKVLWNFHRWMRQETDLNSGSIVDYRKYAAEMLNEDGALTVASNEIESTHRKAAYNKYLEFRKSLDNAKQSTEGGGC